MTFTRKCEKLYLDWDSKKTARYLSIPTAPRRPGKPATICEKLDIFYERIEGLADYADYRNLLSIGMVQSAADF